MRIASVVGTRPQIIKAAIVSHVLASVEVEEKIIHTGQHYDLTLSENLANELELPSPDVNLGVGSGSHGYQTGEMLKRIEDYLLQVKPDVVVLYGDTNSTLAGALAAAKLNLPIAHVEAGVRHYDRSVPEEVNRVLTDHVSSLLFCPTELAVRNLSEEGIVNGVHWTGDVMLDSVLANAKEAETNSNILSDLGIRPGEYCLATVHRASNTDDPDHLGNIFEALDASDLPVVVPLHPRTRGALSRLRSTKTLSCSGHVMILEPVGYRDSLWLQKNAKLVLTDSGGIQKEAYFLGTPCITLRTYSPWPETVEDGWNVLVPPEKDKILAAIQESTLPRERRKGAFGDGTAALKIARCLQHWEDARD